jgi:nitroreductase
VAPFTSGLLRKRLLSPRTKVSLKRFFDDKKAGKDRIFFNAPCVIVLHAPPYSKMTASDSAIAITHGILAAHSLGLATCWIGFAQEHLWRNKKSRTLLGIPKQNNVYGVFVIGHPAIEYSRAPPRREARVKWKK